MSSSNDSLSLQIRIQDEGINLSESSFWNFLLSLFIFIIWIIFITFYLARITAPIVSFLLNRYLRITKTPGHIRLGSLSISFFGGKLMFKDFLYANDDYSLRINDGWVIFSYWKFVPGKKVSFKSGASRLHVSLNGLQLNFYNRVQRYKEIAKLFRFEKFFGDDCDVKKNSPLDSPAPSAYWDRVWALLGVIRLDIWSGRVVAGNRLLPYLFVFSWENMNSKIRLHPSSADRALLKVEGQMESIRASLLKHPEYEGKPYKDPPRTMGDGFAVLQSASLQFFYHQDILGFVTEEYQSSEKNRPVWESIFRFDHNTVISYGPWAEQQRALIYSFFFPPDYQTAVVTELPKHGKGRIQIMHDVRISLLKETSIDIWFMRGDELDSIHNRCQPGSTIDMSIWWITKEDGFSWSAHSSLLNVETTTSLVFRKLFECETLQIDCDFHYPRVFNAKQTWKFNYTISKATAWFLWDHKRFFVDLINEWSGDTPQDLASFIPYTVDTNVVVNDNFEFILLLNECNWIDSSDKSAGNVEAAIVGQSLNFSFMLVFIDFLPERLRVEYDLRASIGLALRMKYPADSWTSPVLAALTRAARTTSNANASPYGTYSSQTDVWHEMWRTESLSCKFVHVYHPLSPTFPSSLPYHVLQDYLPKKVDHPMKLASDLLDVSIEFEGSELIFTGLLIKIIIELKNNYFGLYDSLTEIGAPPPTKVHSQFNRVPPLAPPELYRPMDVNVHVRLFNLRAQCIVHASCGDIIENCPVFYTEEVAVEVKKNYHETLIQVGVQECAAHFDQTTSQSSGFLSLSSLQFRGHAMFSPLDVPWDMAILEYGWLMEILVGDVNGSLDFPGNVMILHQVLESLILLVLSKDDDKVIPPQYLMCQHGQLESNCSKADNITGIKCLSEESLKYRQMRIAVDGIHLALVEEKTLINIDVDPVRFTLCNAHNGRFTEHICLRLPKLIITQAFKASEALWLECARLAIQGVSLDIELPLSQSNPRLERLRYFFVQKHDSSSRRLHFLYEGSKNTGCACFGNTRFFSDIDVIGQMFLLNTQKKMCIASIVTDENTQPGYLQSVLFKNQKMMIGGKHFVYPSQPRKKISSIDSVLNSAIPSLDTGSFHSAQSKPLNDSRVSSSPLLMSGYSSFLSHLSYNKQVMECPQFGESGDIARWVNSRVTSLTTTLEGISYVSMITLNRNDKKDMKGANNASRESTAISNAVDYGDDQRLAIQGTLAQSVDLFFSPLAVEGVERLVSSVSKCLSTIHPSFLVQMCYRECVFRDHRQPLTESLFAHDRETPVIELSVELPRLQISLLQCGHPSHRPSSDHLPRSPAFSMFSADMVYILLDKGTVTAVTLKEAAVTNTTFVLDCSMLTAQLLHLTSSSQTDFMADRVPFHSMICWKEHDISDRIKDREPRVVFDLQVPDLAVTLDRKEIRKLETHDTMNSGNMQFLHEHKARVEVGGIHTLFVMARPLELTPKNEFPIYDVLSPSITAWIAVVQRLDAAIERLTSSYSAWSDMTLARVLKMALDSSDERVFGVKSAGKAADFNCKKLGRHQAGCPTCLLLHTLLRWCAFSEEASSLTSPVAIRSDFANENARKMALQALLSHWHPDICQQVKLVSNTEAAKYRIDPSNMRKETRIDIEGGGMKGHQRTASSASRAALVRDSSNMTTNQKRPSEPEQKMDLYHMLLSAHKERKERRENSTASDIKTKDYINPMDILPQAFFRSFYRSRRLDWTQLDGVPIDRLSLTYEVTIRDIGIGLVEQRLMCSPDMSRKVMAPYTHQLLHVKKVAAEGKIGWRIEMDEKALLPLRGWMNIDYTGSIENVRFVVALSSVCLAKEVSLVIKTASDTLADLKMRRHSSAAMTPLSDRSTVTARSPLAGDLWDWDDKVLDMMNDFQKNMQRSNTVEHRGDVLTKVRGQLNVDSVRLESMLTDLYVSLMIQMIELTQENNPDNQENIGRDIFILVLKLRKASLALMESDKTKQNQHIVNCSLQESRASITRRLMSKDRDMSKLDTKLIVLLGAIEGELPMAAHSLHDVVMRHGPQLELQFNRLSAQPAYPMTASSLADLPILNSTELCMDGPNYPPQSRRQPPPIFKLTFSLEVASLELRARLLPSLLAKYRLNRASSSGVTGDAANWVASMDGHHAEFCVSMEGKANDTFTLDLPTIGVTGAYSVDKGCAPDTDKTLLFREGGYLKMTLTLGKVKHSFTTNLLNQILFAEQSFRSELSALIQRLRAERPSYASSSHPVNTTQKTPLLFFLTIKGTGEPWLQLTAATPTSTAVRFTIDTLETELTNRWVVKEEGSKKERLFGVAVIQFNAKLGQLVKVAQYEEIQAELQEYATFMTQIRVENKESTEHTSYSYHISLNRPILLLKSSAIDKAILLWLNYKNAYDFWRTERNRVVRSQSKRASIPHAMFSPQPSQEFDVNLSLAINNGMYVCMPLFSQDFMEGMPALVLSLQKSDVTVCIKKELACQASFHGFKLNFIDNFDEQSLSESFKEATGDAHTNYFFFPQGSYQLCSQASAESGDAQWVLSVRSQMRGMVIDLDHRIGKLAKLLVNTLSSLGEDEDEYGDEVHSNYSTDPDEEMVDGAAELRDLTAEGRVAWMERKMHEQSNRISHLVAVKAVEQTIETERRKLRQYELIRFKQFRRSMMEKLRRRNDHRREGKRPSMNLETHIGHIPPVGLIGENRNESEDIGTKKAADTVNMHIDVQVSIESGRCTLRTAPKVEPITTSLAKRPSTKDLRAKPFLPSQPLSATKFSIPSVDLRGYYMSMESSPPSGFTPQIPKPKMSLSASDSLPSFLKDQKCSKRGCFYLSVALSSMPSETLVTPHLADYFEQVLEPLPVQSFPANSIESLPESSAEGMNNIVAIDTSVLPLDVIFYLTVQSSTIRFDGQQQRSSAADCLLKLPCLTLMASTRRTEDSEYIGGIDISATLSAFSLSIYSPHQQSTAHDALSLTLDHLSFVVSRSKNSSTETDNRVRFVLTSNIGAAVFNYDMRRLSELMAFPKPWYRAAIARRVFFGDQSVQPQKDTSNSRASTIASHPLTTKRRDGIEKAWSATVLLAVQWKELNVNAQMANTMGNTKWNAKRGLLRANAKLNSRLERDVTVTFKLNRSELTAHGGAISGEIGLSELLLSVTHKRLFQQPPRNSAKLELQWLAACVEWMSRAVLTGRVERPRLNFGDDFHTTKDVKGEVIRAEVSLNVKGAWDDLQIVITRGTVDDIHKIANKLNTFFQEQLKSSKMVWGIADDISASGAAAPVLEDSNTQIALATVHWEKVLDTITEIQSSLKILPLPRDGETVIGGSVEVEAGKISLVCMHGEMNANSWALFHMRQAGILFSPEAQYVFIDKEKDRVGVNVKQKLILRLGETHSNKSNMQTENLATVCRVQQSRNLMRQNASIQSSLDYLIGDVLKQLGLAGNSGKSAPAATKTQHSVLELFQFPALEAVLTTVQQNECDPEDDIDPEVISSFITEFHNAVNVQTDFNAQVSFLPELLNSYIKVHQDELPPEEKTSKTDRRQYKCEHWLVDPKIRFIDRFKWNPPVIDEVLKKLQIFDHRTTIPKALQRALLDPLDAGLSLAIGELLRLVDKTKHEDNNK